MKKGFTLIEILAVVTIIGLIFILVIPKIATSLKNKKGDVDTTTNNIVLAAAKSYVADNHDKFDKTDNNTYCLPISTLTKKEYLESPVKNVTDDVDITNTKSVKITYNKGFKYEVVDKKECEVVYIPPCESDYCDSNGNGYTEVEYLESTGTQYIDSETRLTLNTEFELKFGFTKSQSYFNTPYGLIQDNNFLGLYSYGNGNIFTSFGNKLDIVYNDNIINYFKIYRHNKNGLWVDGEKKITYENTSVNNSNASIILFARIQDNQISRNSSMKLYYMKIRDNDTLVRDFVPVINSNGRPCLYDKVEHKCYYNQGTGEFLYG